MIGAREDNMATPLARGIIKGGSLTRVDAERNRVRRGDEARYRGSEDAARDGYVRTGGFSYMTDEEYAASQREKDALNADRLMRRGDSLERKGDRKAQKRRHNLDWRQDAYNAAFEDLRAESQDAYRPIIERGRGYVGQGDRIFGGAVGGYQRLLAGQEPSLAELAVRRGADRAAATGMALASSGRGNPALAMRAAQQQAAQTGQQAAAQAGQIRMQEQAQARAALMGAGQFRSDQGNSLQMEAQGTLADNLEDERNAISEEFKTDRARADQRRQARQQMGLQAAGAVMSAAGEVGGAFMGGKGEKGGSDKRMKEDIKDPSGGLKELLDALEGSKEYDYKEGSDWDDGERHVSPMAQDLAKTALGKALVEPDDEGRLMVDYGKGAPLAMAALGNLHKRMKALEGRAA